MEQFAGRVAVVTGAASGIGRALAGRFAGAGMRLVLADVEEDALAAAERELRAAGAEAVAVPTDAARAESVDALADRAYAAFGAVHVLCNNAGVGGITAASYRATLADWEWTLGVNLWGPIHGGRAFLPRMIAGGEEGHVVNTASIAGLLPLPGNAPYGVSKAGVVALSEALLLELERRGAPIGVSVLCPGLVRTNILDSARNRPESLRNPAPDPPAASPGPPSGRPGSVSGRLRAEMERDAMDPADVAERVLEAIRGRRFWILPHEGMGERVRQRAEGVASGVNPSARPGR